MLSNSTVVAPENPEPLTSVFLTIVLGKSCIKEYLPLDPKVLVIVDISFP